MLVPIQPEFAKNFDINQTAKSATAYSQINPLTPEKEDRDEHERHIGKNFADADLFEAMIDKLGVRR